MHLWLALSSVFLHVVYLGSTEEPNSGNYHITELKQNSILSVLVSVLPTGEGQGEVCIVTYLSSLVTLQIRLLRAVINVL